MANKKRQEVEQYILKWIKKITKSAFNVNLYKDMFKNMTDEEFDKFMHRLKEGNQYLQVIVPPDIENSDVKITLANNYKLAKELNYDFFQELDIGPNGDIPRYRTPHKFLIIDLPIRRTKQTSEKGVSVSLHAKNIDMLTGQPKGDSTANRISYPELQVLVGMGLTNSLIELLRDRGGDITTEKLLITGLTKYGVISQKLLSQYATGALSTKSLKNYLLGMHIKSTL